jgi:prephenate dehydratase
MTPRPNTSSDKPRVAFLGPIGSFSHQAAIAIFGDKMDQHPLASPHEVIHAVAERRYEVTHAVVPIENAVCGRIDEVADLIDQLPVAVMQRHPVPVELCLIGSASPRRIHSKREVFKQCERWLRRHHPDADCIEAPSSSAAVAMLPQTADKETAAIGSALAARLYEREVIATGIADVPANRTEFVVLVAKPST